MQENRFVDGYQQGVMQRYIWGYRKSEKLTRWAKWEINTVLMLVLLWVVGV